MFLLFPLSPHRMSQINMTLYVLKAKHTQATGTFQYEYTAIEDTSTVKGFYFSFKVDFCTRQQNKIKNVHHIQQFKQGQRNNLDFQIL